MLEGVTLGQVVELVVEVLIDLAGSAVLDQQTAENAEAAHPDDSGWHTGIGRTLALTESLVATESLRVGVSTSAGTRVHGDWLADDKSISDQLADGLAGVGVGDLGDLVWVEPNLALTASDDGSREALLGAKVNPVRRLVSLCYRMYAIVPPSRRMVSVLRIRSIRDTDRGRRGVVIDSITVVLGQNPLCDRMPQFLNPIQRREGSFPTRTSCLFDGLRRLSMVVVDSRRPSTNFWWALSRIGPPRLPNTSARIVCALKFGTCG